MKLYRCELTHTFYAYASSGLEAEGFAEEAMRNDAWSSHVDAEEVRPTDKIDHAAEGWTPDCLAYTAIDGPEVTLADAWPKPLPAPSPGEADGTSSAASPSSRPASPTTGADSAQ